MANTDTQWSHKPAQDQVSVPAATFVHCIRRQNHEEGVRRVDKWTEDEICTSPHDTPYVQRKNLQFHPFEDSNMSYFADLQTVSGVPWVGPHVNRNLQFDEG